MKVAANTRRSRIMHVAVLLVFIAATIVPVHGIHRHSVGSVGPARSSAWSRSPINFQDRRSSGARRAISHCTVIERIPFQQSTQMRGGATTVRHYFDMFVALGFPLMIFMYFYVYNKIAEGAWFYVVPRLWAWLTRRPFQPTLHKMSWKWWHPAFDEDHYVSCLVKTLLYGSLLYVIVPLHLPIVQEEIKSRWALVQKGSGDAWLHLLGLGRILFWQLVLLFAPLIVVSEVWSQGECFLTAVAYGTNRREKAIISVAAVATMVAMMFALYFLPSPLALIP